MQRLSILLMGLVGCGNDGKPAAADANGGGIDAPLGDVAGPDATPVGCPEPPTTGELAHVTVAFLGVGGHDVIWHNADGSVRGCTKTDSSGKTQLRIEPNSMVTAIAMGSSIERALTVTGVQPGEDLRLLARILDPATLSKVRVRYSGGEFPNANSNSYFYNLGCDGGLSPNASTVMPDDWTVLPECLTTAGKLNAYAEAREDNVQIAGLAYALARDVTPTPPLTEITMGAWRTDWIDAPFTIENPPSAVSSLTVGSGWREDGVDFIDFDRRLSGGSIPMEGSITLPGRKLPRDIGDSMYFNITLNLANGATSIGYLESPGALGPRTIDVSNFLPKPTSVTTDYSLPGRPKVMWTGDASLLDADFVQARFSYDMYEWTILAPANTTIQFPELPDFAGRLRPPAGPIGGRLAIVENDAFTGYDQARNAGVLHGAPGAGTEAEFRGRYVLQNFY